MPQFMGSQRAEHELVTEQQQIVLVSAMYQHESAIGIQMSLLLEPSSHLPLHPNPLGCHRALI